MSTIYFVAEVSGARLTTKHATIPAAYQEGLSCFDEDPNDRSIQVIQINEHVEPFAILNLTRENLGLPLLPLTPEEADSHKKFLGRLFDRSHEYGVD